MFSSAEERARKAKAAAEAKAKKKADAAEKARQDAERRAFQSAGLPYTPSTPAPAATSSSSVGSSAAAGTAGFVETTGADLANKGVGGLKGMLDKIREAGGGVLFVDEVRLVLRVAICGCPNTRGFCVACARLVSRCNPACWLDRLSSPPWVR